MKNNNQTIAAEIIDRAKKLGAAFTEVMVSSGVHSFKRITDGEVYQPTAGEGISISMSSIIDGRRVSKSFDAPDEIEREVNNLFASAKFLPKDAEELFIPTGPYPAASVDEKLLYDPETAKMDDSSLIHAIQEVNGIVEANGFVFDGAISQGTNEFIFANSAGTLQSSRSTSSELSIFGFDPKDRSVSAYRTVAGKGLGQFSIRDLAEDVKRKLEIQTKYFKEHGGKRIDPFGGKVGPQRFDVIMEPSCWAGLLAIFSGQAEAWNGKAFQEGRSFFSGKLGSKVMGDNITIYDDPLNPLGIPQAFDYEGFPKKKLALVEKGIAKNVVYDNALAKKYGTVSTGHALPAAWRGLGALPLHLAIEGGNSSVEEMIKASKNPTLWITTLHYIRATHNQDGRTTGTTLHGVFLVKDGEVVGPTEHLRFDESVPEALSRVTHVGKALPTLSMEADETPYIIPAMRSEQFRFVSVNDRSV
jgi:PmbA protein